MFNCIQTQFYQITSEFDNDQFHAGYVTSERLFTNPLLQTTTNLHHATSFRHIIKWNSSNTRLR